MGSQCPLISLLLAIEWMFVFPQISFVEILMSEGMVLGGGALMNGIIAL